jgi:hypothetical protein
MKAAVIKAAAVLALIAATNSQALAQDKASETSTTAAEADGTGPDNKGAVMAPGNTTLNANTTNPVTQSSASLPAAIKAAQPRKVFGELYTESYIKMTDLEHSEKGALLNSYGGVKFDLGNTNSIALRQYFDYQSAGGGADADIAVQDTVINFTRGELAKFSDGTTLTLIARAYLPTGESSRAINQNGRERLYLIAAKSLGKFDLSYIVLGQLWQQSNQAQLNEKGEWAQNNIASLSNEFDAFYNINSKLALGMIVGMDNIAKGRAPGKSTSVDDVYFQPTIQVAPVKGLTIQALLYNELNIRSPEQEHRLFRGKETQFAFNVAASL